MHSAGKYEKVPTSTKTNVIVNRLHGLNSNRSSSSTLDEDTQFINRNSEVSESGSIMPITNLPTTNSSQQLMGGDTESVSASLDATSTADEHGASTASLDTIKRPASRNSQQYEGFSSITYQEWFTVVVLCFVNLINYMDRFTIAGIITQIQHDFEINDASGGLIQTVFVISYMICAPIFGYLGDRYSRRWIMISGVALWSGTTLLGSYMPTYNTFMIFRALVGIGEASYSTIAPTIISDLFVNDVRSKMLAMFYFAIPVGSGLGYIVGAQTAGALGDWRWALRVTPILGVIAVILIFLTKEPERGQHEGSHHMQATSYTEDLKDIARNPSFMLSTLGFTCVAFVTGALAWWGPKFMHSGLQLQPGNENIELKEVAFKFGAITMVSGIIGVPLGTIIAEKLKKRSQRADPIICACGLILSAPLIAGSMLMITQNTTIAYILVFFGEVALNLNWAIVADILLYVVMPTRRSTAEAFQILISHAFGDAGSPYLIGLISDALKASMNSTKTSGNSLGGVHSLAKRALNITANDKLIEFKSLQYSLFSTSFIEVLGGIFFLFTSAYIIRDKLKVEQAIAESQIGDISSSQSSSHDPDSHAHRFNDTNDHT